MLSEAVCDADNVSVLLGLSLNVLSSRVRELLVESVKESVTVSLSVKLRSSDCVKESEWKIENDIDGLLESPEKVCSEVDV